MALIETLVTGISTAVAKGVLKLWLKDDPLVLAASTTTADLLKAKLASVLDRRAADRELAKITDRSAASFQQMLEKEDNELAEADVEFIANAAAAVIDQTELTVDLLAQNDLDPDVLCDFFWSRPGKEGGNPALANHEDPVWRGLFRRLLLTASQQIVDISSRLPLFSERVFREMLQRENRIYDVAVKVLDGMDQLLAAQQGLDPEAEQYETNLRLACIRQHDHLRLFGVDLDQSNQRYKLNVAYVTLDVEKTTINDLDDETGADSRRTEDDDDFREAMPVDQALAKAPRLLVRGLAGAGKTTLVQWAAVFCAAREHVGDLETCNDFVPFVIKLRDLEDGKLPNPDEFARFVAPSTGGEPQHWSHRKLSQGRAMLLIDGLDEAAEEQRDEVRAWLKNLLDQYPNARYIVTTRPHAVDEGWMDDDGFVDATLQDMTPRDVARFVKHWHDAIASGLDDDEDKAKLPQLCEALLTELKKNGDLARLATSPLLCAMIRALHRDRNQALPKNRIGLYRACVDMFFRRDNQRKVRMEDYVALNDDQKLLLLRSFAWWLIRNGKSSATEAETYERLDHALTELNPPPKDATGEKVARLFIHRVAMLQRFATGKINFPHRTFQEYLAAQEALAEGDNQLIIDNAEKEQWREVAILAAGLIENKDNAEQFVMDILARGDKQSAHQQTLYLIGAAARQNVSRLPDSSTLEPEAKQRLEKIIPPESMKSAQALAKAGSLVIPLLQYNRKQRASGVAASVRTLALIDSPEALSTLLDYVSDDRTTVRRQLHIALQHLSDDHRSELFHRLLPAELSNRGLNEQSASTIEKLDLSRIPFLTECCVLRDCPSLKTLDLSWCSSLADVSDLGNCKLLQTLKLFSCSSLSDVSALGNCKLLQMLDLSWCSSLADVSALENCESLQTLDLSWCSSLADVSALGNCPSLQDLNLSSCNLLSDVNALENCPSLQDLDLRSCNLLSDVSALENCKSLQTLKLWSCSSLSDVSALGNCESLQNLELSYCSLLSDVSGLGNCNSIQELDLSSCSSLSDVSGLGNCNSIQELDLSSCSSLSDVSGLGNCNSLRTLDLSYCSSLSDLSGLENCQTLRRLTVSLDSKIAVASLTKLKQLEKLHIYGGSETQIETLKKALPKCNVC